MGNEQKLSGYRKFVYFMIPFGICTFLYAVYVVKMYIDQAETVGGGITDLLGLMYVFGIVIAWLAASSAGKKSFAIWILLGVCMAFWAPHWFGLLMSDHEMHAMFNLIFVGGMTFVFGFLSERMRNTKAQRKDGPRASDANSVIIAQDEQPSAVDDPPPYSSRTVLEDHPLAR